MNLGLVRSLGLELCSIALLAFTITTLRFRDKYQWSKLSCRGMVFLDLLRLTSLNVSCVVALSQVHPTMILARLIWLRLPYAGYIGESIVNRLVRRLKRCFKEPVCFKNFYQAKKLSLFWINKDPNPMYLKSHVIYKLTCPACNAEYIGKTDRCLRVRLDEHNSDYNSAMFQHLHSCEAFKFSFLWLICLVVLTRKPL